MKALKAISGDAASGPNDGARVLAPGAPLSPGPCPNDLAQHLEHGEVLAWWGEKLSVQFGLAAITLGAAAVALLLVTGFAPTFWSQPFSDLWPPVIVLLSPTLLVLARETTSRTALLVTNTAIVEIPRRGAPRRLALQAIAGVQRDWVRGGLRVDGPNTAVHVPTSLMEESGKAVRSRLKGRVRTPRDVSDPLRWLS